MLRSNSKAQKKCQQKMPPNTLSISGLQFQNMENLYMCSQVSKICIKETCLSEIEGGKKTWVQTSWREVNCEVCFQEELYKGQIYLIKPLEYNFRFNKLIPTETRFIRNIQTGLNWRNWLNKQGTQIKKRNK